MGSREKTVRLWDPAAKRMMGIFLTGAGVNCLTCSSDSSRVYAGLASGEVLFLQLEPPPPGGG